MGLKIYFLYLFIKKELTLCKANLKKLFILMLKFFKISKSKNLSPNQSTGNGNALIMTKYKQRKRDDGGD